MENGEQEQERKQGALVRDDGGLSHDMGDAKKRMGLEDRTNKT